MKTNYRQGDVILVPCGPMKHGEISEESVLAYGEITGHLHKIVEGEVRLSKLSGDELLLEILSDQAILRHGTSEQMKRQAVETDFDYEKEDCHKPQILPKGFMKILIQKDYEPAGWKKVSD